MVSPLGAAHAGAAAVSYSEQASVGDWPMRILLTVGTLAVIALLLLAARRGWRRRLARQGFATPESADPGQRDSQSISAEAPIRAKYLGTAYAENLFERVVAGSGPAQVTITSTDGVLSVQRTDGTILPLTSENLRGVEIGSGLLQKSYHRHGVVLVTWDWDGRGVVSGFWVADRATQQILVDRLRALSGALTGDEGVGR